MPSEKVGHLEISRLWRAQVTSPGHGSTWFPAIPDAFILAPGMTVVLSVILQMSPGSRWGWLSCLSWHQQPTEELAEYIIHRINMTQQNFFVLVILALATKRKRKLQKKIQNAFTWEDNIIGNNPNTLNKLISSSKNIILQYNWFWWQPESKLLCFWKASLSKMARVLEFLPSWWKIGWNLASWFQHGHLDNESLDGRSFYLSLPLFLKLLLKSTCSDLMRRQKLK